MLCDRKKFDYWKRKWVIWPNAYEENEHTFSAIPALLPDDITASSLISHFTYEKNPSVIHR